MYAKYITLHTNIHNGLSNKIKRVQNYIIRNFMQKRRANFIQHKVTVETCMIKENFVHHFQSK